MRIDTNQRTAGVSARSSAGRPQAGAVFQPASGDAPARAAAAAPVMASGALGSLLAIQAADDPLQGRRKAVRRGKGLLDSLELIKADLLGGQVGQGRLEQLMAMLGEARDRSEPELDAVLDDVELRVRVELAKLGHYPAF